MKLLLQIHTVNDSGNIPRGNPLQTGILLPRGCGIDTATAEITKVAEGFKAVALELFKAETEGREPRIAELPVT